LGITRTEIQLGSGKYQEPGVEAELNFESFKIYQWIL